MAFRKEDGAIKKTAEAVDAASESDMYTDDDIATFEEYERKMQAAYGDDEPDEDEEWEISQANAETVSLFFQAVRLLRLAPMGGVLGFDWQQLTAKAKIMRLRITQDAAEGLDAMERAMLAAIAKTQAK